jgi:hypothetical protein
MDECHDNLEKTDIFFENSRSLKQEFKNFSLFSEVQYNDKNTVYVCPVYLELYEFSYSDRIRIIEMIDYICNFYHSNRVIFQWNHDKDFSVIEKNWNRPPNAYIINFNTSKAHPNDIIVPFWVINTKWIEESKQYMGGFIGSINNDLRKKLVRAILQQKLFIYKNGLPTDEFLKTTSRCYYSLCPRGQGLNSYRFFESFHLNSIPVLYADDIILPFYKEIDYNDICIKIPESKIDDLNSLSQIISGTDFKNIIKNIKILRHKFSLLGVQEEIHRQINL